MIGLKAVCIRPFKELKTVSGTLVGCQRLNAEEGMGEFDNRKS